MSRYIDFEDPANRDTYTGRAADPQWATLFEELVHPRGRLIADLGCGGGIYTRALAGMGAKLVVGLDSSRLSLDSARKYCKGLSRVSFAQADAEFLGLGDNSLDGIVERALIHHLRSVSRNFAEARRVLNRSGVLWVQDRTIEDALLAPSDEHIRGYYMVYDKVLRDTEIERRRREGEVTEALGEAGFGKVKSQKIHELRKIYRTPHDLRDEILTRRGRSLLHKLDDRRLLDLSNYVISQIHSWPVSERDTWTIWTATK